MTEEETLRHYLNRMGIGKESTAGFVVSTGNVDMQVSRRYLECNAFRYILDMIIDHLEPVRMTNDILTVRFCLKNS